jgi:hypothetical protein
MLAATRIAGFLRTRGGPLAGELGMNFVAPFIIYSLTSDQLGDVGALLASSVPPILWSGFELIRHRRIDALSLFVLGGIALSMLAALGGGGARMLQLREKLVTAVIAVIFLGSAAIGRPVVYELARATMRRRNAEDDLAKLEELRNDLQFRRMMMIMTVVWGVGLVIDVAIGAALVFSLSIEQYLIVGPIVGYANMGLLALWTFWYGRRGHDDAE